MGRHNTVAGRMAASAEARGRLFTKLTREIMVTAKAGADINTNAALRAAVTKAKDNSVPKETIERAIKKGSGELGAAQYEEITYEGYGPAGTAIMVNALTDNRNRTFPEIRQIFLKNGGTIGEMGVVAWMFKKKGVFVFDLSKASEDKIMEIALEAGADDVVSEEGYVTVYSQVTDFAQVREGFVNANIAFEKAGLELIPDNNMDLSEEDLQLALQLVDKLEGHDDVQSVFHNFN